MKDLFLSAYYFQIFSNRMDLLLVSKVVNLFKDKEIVKETEDTQRLLLLPRFSAIN